MARLYKDGTVVDYTPVSDVNAGTVVVQSELVGIAPVDIPAGTKGVLAVQGTFVFPKAVPLAIDVGAKVYWDATNSVVTTNATGTTYLGKAVEAAADSDTEIKVRLNQ